MTNVSKKLLDQTDQEKLSKQLVDLFAAADKNKTKHIFNELFTPAERIMFIKRLAVILLLEKKVSSYRIAQTLKMSQTSVGNLLEQFQRGAFSSIVRTSQSKSFDSEGFWQTIDVLLRAGMPPRGKDRWKFLDNHK